MAPPSGLIASVRLCKPSLQTSRPPARAASFERQLRALNSNRPPPVFSSNHRHCRSPRKTHLHHHHPRRPSPFERRKSTQTSSLSCPSQLVPATTRTPVCRVQAAQDFIRPNRSAVDLLRFLLTVLRRLSDCAWLSRTCRRQPFFSILIFCVDQLSNERVRRSLALEAPTRRRPAL